MNNEENKGKSLMTAGAATAFAGLVLYGVGKVLDYLFRDVDPDRTENKTEAEDKND